MFTSRSVQNLKPITLFSSHGQSSQAPTYSSSLPSPFLSSSSASSSLLSSSPSLSSFSSSSASSSSSGTSTSLIGASGSTPSSFDIRRYTLATSADGSAISYPC